MSSRRWRTIEELFHAALECEPDQRERFLREACQGDEALKHSVEMLLAYDDSSENRLGFYPETVRKSITATLASGMNLGSYRIEEHLGTGGMGVVYRASDSKLGRSVALKIMHPELFASEEGLRRFEREARVLASFNHRNIAAI
jgi:serine/threonine protein kinase